MFVHCLYMFVPVCTFLYFYVWFFKLLTFYANSQQMCRLSFDNFSFNNIVRLNSSSILRLKDTAFNVPYHVSPKITLVHLPTVGDSPTDSPVSRLFWTMHNGQWTNINSSYTVLLHWTINNQVQLYVRVPCEVVVW